MVRHRKSDAAAILQVPAASVFRLHPSRTKNLFLYLCFLQGVTVLTLSAYIIQYQPSLLDDPTTPASFDTLEDTDKRVGSVDAVTEAADDADGYSNKISHLTESFSSSDGHVYTVFRFDKFRNGMERAVPEQLTRDDGGLVYFTDKNYTKDDVPVWMDLKVVYEAGRFEEYGGRLVRMRDVQITPSLGAGGAGGQEVGDVLNQAAHLEYIRLQKGYFLYKTAKSFEYQLPVSVDIYSFAQGLLVETATQPRPEPETNRRDKKTVNKRQSETGIKHRDKVAIVTIRHDFANLYHSTMNWYDVFLIMVMFKLDLTAVEMVWMDSHPRSKMDDAWETLYGEYIRAGALVGNVTYREIIWNGIGARSPINMHKFEDLPYINEFRHFVLSRYNVSDMHQLNCESVRVTIIWRRDHVTHPRNPSGFVSRKIENEEELWEGIKKIDDSLVVNGVQLDDVTMKQQLTLVTQTDILIGMHGAGLAHVLYLPQTSGVIELFPSYYSPANAHFRSMAKWRRLAYLSWVNGDKSRDSQDHKTRLPVHAVLDMVQKMKDVLCEKNHAP